MLLLLSMMMMLGLLTLICSRVQPCVKLHPQWFACLPRPLGFREASSNFGYAHSGCPQADPAHQAPF